MNERMTVPPPRSPAAVARALGVRSHSVPPGGSQAQRWEGTCPGSHTIKKKEPTSGPSAHRSRMGPSNPREDGGGHTARPQLLSPSRDFHLGSHRARSPTSPLKPRGSVMGSLACSQGGAGHSTSGLGGSLRGLRGRRPWPPASPFPSRGRGLGKVLRRALGQGLGGCWFLKPGEAHVSGLRHSQAEDLLTPCPPVLPAGSWDAGPSTQTPRSWPRVKAEKVKLGSLNLAHSPQASWSPGGTGWTPRKQGGSRGPARHTDGPWEHPRLLP